MALKDIKKDACKQANSLFQILNDLGFSYETMFIPSGLEARYISNVTKETFAEFKKIQVTEDQIRLEVKRGEIIGELNALKNGVLKYDTIVTDPISFVRIKKGNAVILMVSGYIYDRDELLKVPYLRCPMTNIDVPDGFEKILRYHLR